MIILGLNINHANSSITLVKDGEILFAAEEERYSFVKNSGAFPINALIKCFKFTNLSLKDVNYITLNSNLYANVLKKIIHGLKYFNISDLYSIFLDKRKKVNIFESLNNLKLGTFSGKIYSLEHHLCHLSSASFCSQHNESLTVSIDGSGDLVSSAVGIFRNNEIKIKYRNYYPHSLGIFYQAMTQFLGFEYFGEEYKVMGLSAYGQNYFKNEMDELINFKDGKIILNLNFFDFYKKSTFKIKDDGSIYLDKLFNKNLDLHFYKLKKIENKTIKQIHMDFAYSLQKKYEEIFFKFLNFYQKKYNQKNLDLSGGCAMNSLANGKIYEQTNFKNLYIQPAAYDAGCSLGSAIYLYNILKKKQKFKISNYLGDSFSNDQCKESLQKFHIFKNSNFEVKFLEDDILYDLISEKIIQKNIVGVFNGRMEWGARALGNRSIICDPRITDMKDILNNKIKRREGFRPFAPIILEEEINNWFEETRKVKSMMQVFKIRSSKRKKIPSVTHVDGTGRLQTVTEKDNKFIYKIIKNFYFKTGVPILINTSFNENEPIVSSPDQAIKTFKRTLMDCLVLGNWVITRKND